MAGGIAGTDKTKPAASLRKIYEDALMQKCDVALWKIKIGTYLHDNSTSMVTLFREAADHSGIKLMSKSALSNFLRQSVVNPPSRQMELQLRAIADFLDEHFSDKLRQSMFRTITAINKSLGDGIEEFYPGERDQIIKAMYRFAHESHADIMVVPEVVPVLLEEYLVHYGVEERTARILSSYLHERDIKNIIKGASSLDEMLEKISEYEDKVIQSINQQMEPIDALSLNEVI